MREKLKHKNHGRLAVLMLAAVMISMPLPAESQALVDDRASSETFKLEEIWGRGVLKVGTTGDYQPMSYLDPETGEYVGFDAELAEDLAADMDVGLEYVETSWPTLMDDLLAGKFDLAICGVTVNDARKEQALMSDGYIENGKTILCRAERRVILSLTAQTLHVNLLNLQLRLQ